MQNFDNKVLKAYDYSKEKDDSGVNPNLLSLLSEDEKDVGARSFTQAAIYK